MENTNTASDAKTGGLTSIGERTGALMTLVRRVWKIADETDVVMSILADAKANLSACEEALTRDAGAAERHYADAASRLRRAGELLMMLSRARLVRKASETDLLF